MAKKKVAKKKMAKKVAKKVVRKPVKKVKAPKTKKVVSRPKRVAMKPRRAVRSSGRKLGFAFKNFIVFAVLALISYFMKGVVVVDKYSDPFFFATFIFGFVALAFLIVLLVLLLLKAMNR